MWTCNLRRISETRLEGMWEEMLVAPASRGSVGIIAVAEAMMLAKMAGRVVEMCMALVVAPKKYSYEVLGCFFPFER